jgi:hypothetical protein
MSNNLGFVIFDNQCKEPYIKVVWPDYNLALGEITTLLKGFSEDSDWRKRLSIKSVKNNPDILKSIESHLNTKKQDRCP